MLLIHFSPNKEKLIVCLVKTNDFLLLHCNADSSGNEWHICFNASFEELLIT